MKRRFVIFGLILLILIVSTACAAQRFNQFQQFDNEQFQFNNG